MAKTVTARVTSETTSTDVATGNGVVDSDTQRVVLATDQPAVTVTGTITTTGLTDTELRATPVPVSGTVSVSEPVSVDDNSGSLTVDAPTGAPVNVQIGDGTRQVTVRDTGASDSLNVAIVDGSGNQVTSFGGGTQYTEGDTDATITGTAILWEDTSDTLRAVSAAKPLPVTVDNVASITIGEITNAARTATGTISSSTTLSIDTEGMSHVTVSIDGASFDGTATIEGTYEGTDWTPLGVWDYTNGQNYSFGTPFTPDPDLVSVYLARTLGAQTVRLNVTRVSGSIAVVMQAVVSEVDILDPADFRTAFSDGIRGAVDVGMYGDSLVRGAGNWVYDDDDTWARQRAAVDDDMAGYKLAAAANMVYDGSTWDRLRGDSINGALVNLGANNDVTVTGTVTANPTRSATATLTNVNDTNVSTTLLSSNANRLAATIWNDSTSILYVKFGTTASTTSATVKIAADGYYEFPQPVYTGRVDGIWSADSTGAARITEMT